MNARVQAVLPAASLIDPELFRDRCRVSGDRDGSKYGVEGLVVIEHVSRGP